MTDRIHVATRKGLFTVEKKGARWAISETSFLGDNVSMVHFAKDGHAFAALDHGHFGVKLQRSTDDGAHWAECATPAFPEPPADWQTKKPPMGEAAPWKLMKIWSLESGGADRSGVLWCGSIPGGLFVSTDWGGSWNLVRTLWDHPMRTEWFGGGAEWPGIHSICVDPRDSRHVTIGVSCGGVWVTRDAGETWACQAEGMRAVYLPPDKASYGNLQDPHLVVQCAANPDVLWSQHHNGVFRTTDGAKSWQEIKDVNPSVFGFAVAVHPGEPDTAWLVPAIKDEKRIPVEGKVVVARTRDGGRSFTILRNGLPQEHAYDLTFRHGLDVDATGSKLAFGSTTGSLWVSEDQGDSWQTVSEHLPPVYAVRFRK
jgi:photosystem II stability/assembly factor-like uncharacterized protein